jgi:uncharacterized repeat protein (TIGR03803 family)
MKKDGSSFAVIHHFPSTGGEMRGGGVSDDGDGFLYGTASYGGANNRGYVFKLKYDGTDFTTIHDFDGDHGIMPWAPVTIKDGVLYGTTMGGGTGGDGTVYRLNKDGSNFAVLHNFRYDGNGRFPVDPLVADNAGNLYGVTPHSNVNYNGTIFKIKMDGSGYTKLHTFNAATGNKPGALILTEDIFGLSRSSSARQAMVIPQTMHREVITLFPNPFLDQVNIISERGLTDITITDINGRVLYQEKKMTSSNLKFGKDLAPGVYMLKAKDGNEVIVQRLVKN